MEEKENNLIKVSTATEVGKSASACSDHPDGCPLGSHDAGSSKVTTPSEIGLLRAELEELKKKDAQKDEQLKLLYDVADRGRVLNYESQRTVKKPFKVKVSMFQEKIIVGWRTVKDILVKNPTTGKTIGEEQEYELLLLGTKGETVKQTVNGYPAFSDARYIERIESEVTGKREGWDGKVEFDLLLPDGRTITLGSRFVN